MGAIVLKDVETGYEFWVGENYFSAIKKAMKKVKKGNVLVYVKFEDNTAFVWP